MEDKPQLINEINESKERISLLSPDSYLEAYEIYISIVNKATSFDKSYFIDNMAYDLFKLWFKNNTEEVQRLWLKKGSDLATGSKYLQITNSLEHLSALVSNSFK